MTQNLVHTLAFYKPTCSTRESCRMELEDMSWGLTPHRLDNRVLTPSHSANANELWAVKNVEVICSYCQGNFSAEENLIFWKMWAGKLSTLIYKTELYCSQRLIIHRGIFHFSIYQWNSCPSDFRLPSPCHPACGWATSPLSYLVWA